MIGWNNKSDDYEEGVVDLDTGELSRPLEEKRLEEKAARAAAKENLLLVEEARGLRYTPKALNSDIKTYQQLLSYGWSPESIIKEYLELISSKFWKEEKKKGRFPGMNTVQFSLRNKQPK